MSKQASGKDDDEPCVALVKRPRTHDLCKATQASGHFVQVFDMHKPWSIATHPWQLVGPKVFNVKINEELLMGLNLCVSGGEHYEVTPYGPVGMKCMDRDGCGGPVRLGDTLQWKCNELLHYESGAVSVYVMLVFIDIKYPLDGIVNVQKIVCDMFQVDADPDIEEPCWMLGSIEHNQRDYWKHTSALLVKENVNLKLEAQNMQLQMQADKDALQAEMQALKRASEQIFERDQIQLQRYKKAIEAIAKVATCGVCHDMMPEKGACMMAPCGHYICAGCFNDYFHALGNGRAKCSVCDGYSPKSDWQHFHCFTGIAVAVNSVKDIDIG